MLRLLALVLHVAVALTAPVSNRGWAVIFDAGSTGTRVHVYSWLPRPGGGLPDVRAEPGGNMKVKPGISTYDSNPEEAGNSILPLVQLAARLVPADLQPTATVMLRATAGMRLLPRRRAQKIYDSLFAAVVANSKFAPSKESFGTLSGNDEGVFGWLSANFLLNTDADRKTPPAFAALGALDLGGGSTQITMPAPAGTLDAVSVPLPAGRPSTSVFTHSHLGFGNKQVLGALTSHEASACLSAGATARWEPSNNSMGARSLTGRGNFIVCEQGIRRVLLGFDKRNQPDAKAKHFVAMSLFYYSINFAQLAGHLPKTSPLSISMLRTAAKNLCAESDGSLRRMVGKDPLTPEDAISWRCFDLVYATRLLVDGYGFSTESESIEFLGDVHGVEVEWTLGALLHDLFSKPPPPAASPRTASSSKPAVSSPADKALAAFLLLMLCMLFWCMRANAANTKTRYQSV